MRCAAVYLLSAVLLMGIGQSVANRAAAQGVPPDQSCGGLLCDMGVFGHKVPAAPAAVAPPPAAPKPSVAPTAAVVAKPPAGTTGEPRLRQAAAPKKRRVVAKAAAPAIPSQARTVAATAPVPAKAAPLSATTPAAETPASDWVIGGPPAGQTPADMFQPIYR